jgi:hypothetical protein
MATDTSLIRLVPDSRSENDAQIEYNSSFQCPPNTVMTGRKHSGDSNGPTIYQYATLKAIDSNGNIVDGSIRVQDYCWTPYSCELFDDFSAGPDQVIIGRDYREDVIGETSYKLGFVLFDEERCTVSPIDSKITVVESDGTFVQSDESSVIIGRVHNDENGATDYYFGTISIDPSTINRHEDDEDDDLGTLSI